MSYKIAFVIPRFDIGKAGGAEIHAAQLARHLTSRGHTIEVFTTCSEDHHLWGNTVAPGEKMIDGIKVHRFPTDSREDVWLFLHLQRKMHLGMSLSSTEEAAWLKNSVHSQALYKTLSERLKDFDGVIFMPYLFGMTYEGSKYTKDKFILIPCLHDEPYAKLKITNDLFQRAQHIFFNTEPERELACRLYNIDASQSNLVALGFDDPPPADVSNFRKKYGLENQPYFIFVGRWEKGKNVDLLIEYFKKFLIHSKRNVKLILLGSGDIQIPKAFEEDILALGFIPLEDKLGAIAGAIALCQPSVNESLSIVIMEAWGLKTPVLVHENCAVTRYHAIQSGGGLYFKDYFEFEEALHFFLDHEELRRKMGILGHQYVRENYSWEKVIDRFEEAFEHYISKQSNEDRSMKKEAR